MHYVHTDHQGSLNVITSESGTIEQEMSFDAWGNRRDPNTWQNLTSAPTNLITDRGFTAHEHMDGFKLINMNGRVYDPVLGRFLSADKVIQAPGYTQSYNRFSYVMNNPLMFTDPSGYKAAMNIEINVTTIYDDRGNVIGMRPYNGNVSQYSGGGSVFPMMGVYGGPRNSMEYDIAFAQNVDNVMGGNSNTSAVRENAEWGYYGKEIDGWVFSGKNNEVFRGVIFSDGSQWYVGDGLTNNSFGQGYQYINNLSGMEVVQKQTNWCAFAIGEMIYKKLNGRACGADQELMAREYYREHNLPENSNKPAIVRDYLIRYFGSNSNYFVTSWGELVSAVRQDIPVLVGLKGTDVGHAVYVYGVSSYSNVNTVYYWDPGRGQGYKQMNGNDFINKTLFIYAVKNPY